MRRWERPTARDVEALVRACLTDPDETVDAAAILAGAHARLKAGPTGVARPSGPGCAWVRRLPPWGWRLTMAALGVVLVSYLALGPNPAEATTLIRAIQEACAIPRDRCYRVVITPHGDDAAAAPGQRALREGVLWTRGDCFRLEVVVRGRTCLFGRDEQQRFWVAPQRAFGIRFNAGEDAPLPITRCGMFGLRVDLLLQELLEHFDLRAEEQRAEDSGDLRIIHGRLRLGQPGTMREVRLTIDTSRKLVRDALLRGPNATASFTLQDWPDGDQVVSYCLEDYLRPRAPIYTPATLDRLTELPLEKSRRLQRIHKLIRKYQKPVDSPERARDE